MSESGREIWVGEKQAGDSKFYLEPARLSTAMSDAENIGAMEKRP
jgi:hypothetical protein